MPRNTTGTGIIDAHNHADWLGINFDRFLANMDAAGIAKTWLLSWVAPRDEYTPSYDRRLPGPLLGLPDDPIPLRCGLAYKERAPERFTLGFAPDPRRPQAIDMLDFAVGAYGIRICGEVKLRMMVDNPDAIRLFRFCGEKRLPVTLHIDYELAAETSWPRPNYWYGGGIDALERTLQLCPDTVFIGHAPGFWAHISGDDQFDKVYYPKGRVEAGGKLPAMLRRHPNLHADLSAGSGLNALQRDPGFAGAFLDEFQDRLLFGRDSFDNQLRDYLETLGLAAAVLGKIYRGNAARLVPEP